MADPFRSRPRELAEQGRTRRTVLTAAWMLAAIAVAAYVGKIWWGMQSVYRPIAFDESEFSRIVQTALADRSAATTHVVVLPGSLAAYSATGRAYVEGAGAVFIPTWIGRKTRGGGDEMSEDAWVEGYLYSPTPELPGGESYGDLGTMYVPAFSSPWAARRDAVVQNIDMFADKRLPHNWYSINSFS